MLRVLREGVGSGGMAVSYVTAEGLLRDEDGRVTGVIARPTAPAAGAAGGGGGAEAVRARVVVKATGAWADRLAGPGEGFPSLRLLRGSHLVFPRPRLPLMGVLLAIHPETRRPIYPNWGRVTLVGTTSVPHRQPLHHEPRIEREEMDYLLAWARERFPERDLRLRDVRSTFAGVRAIVHDDDARSNPDASRSHGIREVPGLVSVAGEKLTAFHSIARRVIPHLLRQLGRSDRIRDTPALDPVPDPWPHLSLARSQVRRLLARYGPEALEAISGALPEDRRPIPGLGPSPAEVRWIVRSEAVTHLDDLLLRRLRVGLTAERGALPWTPSLERIVRPELGWSLERWKSEVEAYAEGWRRTHGVPSPREAEDPWRAPEEAAWHE